MTLTRRLPQSKPFDPILPTFPIAHAFVPVVGHALNAALPGLTPRLVQLAFVPAPLACVAPQLGERDASLLRAVLPEAVAQCYPFCLLTALSVT